MPIRVPPQRLRDECLNTEDFADLLEAQVVLEDWRTQYNAYRPHNPSEGSPPPPTLTTGHTNTNQHTHNAWTHNRVLLSIAEQESHSDASGGTVGSSGLSLKAIACLRQ